MRRCAFCLFTFDEFFEGLVSFTVREGFSAVPAGAQASGSSRRAGDMFAILSTCIYCIYFNVRRCRELVVQYVLYCIVLYWSFDGSSDGLCSRTVDRHHQHATTQASRSETHSATSSRDDESAAPTRSLLEANGLDGMIEACCYRPCSPDQPRAAPCGHGNIV
jgi:hypothetical protein